VKTDWHDKVTELQKTIISIRSVPKLHSVDQPEIQQEEISSTSQLHKVLIGFSDLSETYVGQSGFVNY
jgi:hypothetical protein